jgi:hypothetical protein
LDFFVILLLFYFILPHCILCTTEIFIKKIKYLPSRVGDGREELEACTVSDGGGMAGLCPVYAMQE